MEKVLPFLFGSSQTANVNGSFLGESERLITNIIETCDLEQLEGYLMAIDFDKAFDSLTHNFLITALNNYGFGNDFIEWIKILLKDKKACVINGCHTTKYFRIESGARQGDPISAYLFIVALEILFIFIKFHKNIDGINIFNHECLYSAYVDDTMFFLKNFLNFLKFSGLRPNLHIYAIAGIGVLKNVNVALCCMKSINLTKENIKVLGVHISYYKKVLDDLNFTKTIKNLCSVLKLWHMRKLTLEVKITIFESLAISKIVHVVIIIKVPNTVIEELKHIQNTYMG